MNLFAVQSAINNAIDGYFIGEQIKSTDLSTTTAAEAAAPPPSLSIEGQKYQTRTRLSRRVISNKITPSLFR